MQAETFVFFGIVGSGKGTQVTLLSEFLKAKDGKECVYIGTGEIFRKIAESSTNDPITQDVKEILHSGRLVPDDKTNEVVLSAVNSQASPDKHLIFDGYPRTVAQSMFFEDMMNSLRRENIKIIYIEVGKEEAMNRNLLRGRHDDTVQGLAKRFDEYINNVVPAMNYFRNKKSYEIFTINGEQPIPNVHKDIIKALGY